MDNQIIKILSKIIRDNIPKKIEKLEAKYNIGIHTCGFGKKYLIDGKKEYISITKFCGTSHTRESYQLFINNEMIDIVNNYGFEVSNEEDLTEELIEIGSKICELLNSGVSSKNNKNTKSVFEILNEKPILNIEVDDILDKTGVIFIEKINIKNFNEEYVHKLEIYFNDLIYQGKTKFILDSPNHFNVEEYGYFVGDWYFPISTIFQFTDSQKKEICDIFNKFFIENKVYV